MEMVRQCKSVQLYILLYCSDSFDLTFQRKARMYYVCVMDVMTVVADIKFTCSSCMGYSKHMFAYIQYKLFLHGSSSSSSSAVSMD